MHARRAVLVIHVFFILFVSAEAFSKTLNRSDTELRFLRSELSLAQKTQIYFILDLDAKKIYFKARGIVLRDLYVKKVKFWGSHEEVKLYTLTGKAAFSEPSREEIVPENPEKDEKQPAPPGPSPAPAGKVDIKALELEDMPSSYRLKFAEGLVISVKPETKGIFDGLYSIAHSLYWHLSQPLVTVWYAITSGPYGSLNLVLDEKDARALYWSVHEGARVLIYNPQD